MQIGLLDPEDLFLISMESLIALGLFVATLFAYKIRKKHPRITSEGWTSIVAGIALLMFHAIFDALDTLQFDDSLVDVLNLFDGSTFVIGLLLFAYGVYRIADYGAKQWGL
ncbi:hypothetical protein EU537_04775 [Candidatus Thorarchaeota archaeon]|nr:MAG: hypothetical protein EU537_04775 [Candidatus Thorarchaeota archaeon]